MGWSVYSAEPVAGLFPGASTENVGVWLPEVVSSHE